MMYVNSVTPISSFGAVGTSTCRSTRVVNNLHMKIYDWKQREAFKTYEIPDSKLRSSV